MKINEQIKIIFLDCDFTTFDHSHFEVRPLTMYSLRKLKERGYKICISTSRNFDEMRAIDPEYLNLADVVCTLAGAHIIFKDDKISFPINANDVKKLTTFFDENKIIYRYATTSGKGYLSCSNDYIDSIFYKYFQMIPEVKKYENEDVLQFMYYTFDFNIHEKIKKLVPNLIVNNMAINSEISSNNVDKSLAMDLICQKFGLTSNQAMAFGDSENDNTMLKKAYFGVCMGNGIKQTKEIADYVCEDIEDDGVYKTFVKYDFIEPYQEEDKYFFDLIDKVCNLDDIRKKQIEKIATIFVETIKNDGVIQMLGIGKLEQFAQELYYRSGGLVAFHKMSLNDFKTIEQIDDRYELDNKDAYLLISEEGKEEIIQDFIKRCKNNGQKIILCLREKTKNIKEADAYLWLNEIKKPIKYTCDDVLAQFLSFETYHQLQVNNIEPLIFMSNNNPDSKKHNQDVLINYGKRVHE